MGNKKKNIFNILFLVIVFGLTIYSVFKGQNIEKVLQYTSKAKAGYLLAGIVCVVVFIFGESTIIFYMMRTLKEKVTIGHCYLYSFVGFFFSCITPSATGGQPAQIYFMKRDKIPIPVSTLVLLIVTITYKAVLVVIGLFVMLFQPRIVHTYLEPVLFFCWLGLALNIFCVAFMMIVVFHPSFAKMVMMKGLRLLERLHLMKHKEERATKLARSMDQYNATAAYYWANKMVIVKVLLITLVQRLILFFVTYLTYRAFGLDQISAYDIILLQGMISVSVDMLPLPGGMGISEHLFLKIFLPVFGAALTLPGMIVSRGISYYSQVTISAVMTIVAYFVIKEKKSIPIRED